METTASFSTQNMTSQAFARSRSALVRRLLATEAGWEATAARLALAVVMFPHGAQKAFGWFGGYGWSGTMGFLTGTIGLPAPLAALVILIELLAPLLLLLGLATRAAALGIAAVMVGAVATVHLSQGFFMNWSGTQAGEGFEFHLLALGLAVALALGGGGRLALDRRIAG
jgi:putative oxidoreductase